MRCLSRGIVMLCFAVVLSCNAQPTEQTDPGSTAVTGGGEGSAEVHAGATASPEEFDEADALDEAAAPGPMALHYAGGVGGAMYRAVCPPQSVVVGMHGRSGTIVNALAVVCAPLGASSDHAQARDLGRSGGTGGDVYEQQCADGQAALGVAGGAGSVVDSVGLLCGPVQGDSMEVVELARAGGAGGEPYQQRCPVGTVMVGVQGGAGSIIDSVQVLCDTTERVQAGASFPDDIEPTHLRATPLHEGGYLGVSSSPRGVVWLNGESTGERTPMRRYPVAEGAHRVQVQYDSGQMSEVRHVDIREHVLTNVFIREAAPASDGSGAE